MPAFGRGAVVLLCDDVGWPGPDFDATRVARAIEGEDAVAVAIVPGMCLRPGRVRDYLGGGMFDRVVVGCAGRLGARRAVLAHARRQGLAPAAACTVPLGGMSEPVVDPEADAIALLRAGLAQVAAIGAGEAGSDAARRRPLSAPLTRRALFGLADREPLPTCSPGPTLAAGLNLARSASRLGRGVAMVCATAAEHPALGSGWLGLEVGSLEPIGTGLPLQLVATGVPAVTYRACRVPRCSSRARGVWEAARMLLRAVGVADADRRLQDEQTAAVPEGFLPQCHLAAHDEGLQPTEPEASVSALRSLVRAAATAPAVPMLPVRHPAIPTARVLADPAACTLCGACARACPTGALRLEEDASCSRLVLRAGRCPGCGFCREACPHGALRLERIFEAGALDDVPVELTAAPRRRCSGCGRGMAPSLVTEQVGARLADSHPRLTAGLLRYCSECLLLRADVRKDNG